MKKSIKKVLAIASASFLALAAAITVVPNTAEAGTPSKACKKAAKAAFDPSGKTEYHAYFGMQQKNSWIFRDPWYEAENGLNGKTLPEGGDFNTVYQNKDGNNPFEGPVLTDAVIKGNGVYSVGVENLGGILTNAERDESGEMSMLFCNTDIPTTAKDKVTISDLKFEIDGMEQTLPENIFFCEESELETGLIRFDPFNAYQKDQGAYPDCPTIRTPNDSVKITFKISGFDVDDPDAVEATPTPVPEATSSSSSSSNGGGLSAGAVAGIVIAVVAIIAIIVVVVKKKND